jgi:ABC-type uncharacterized transport system auxiliary subunit
MKKILFVILAVFGLSACTMPETKIYSIYLNTSPAPAATKEETKGVIGKLSDASLVVVINSPRYLSQPYIAYRNSPYQLEISRYSKWESSPNDIVKKALKDSLSAEGIFKEVRDSAMVPEGFYSLEIDLKKFERYDEGNSSSGELVLDAKLFSPDNKELKRIAISKRVKLQDRSFLSLAKGLSQAVNDAVQEIRGALLVTMNPQPAFHQ